jgi:hypothetical protein
VVDQCHDRPPVNGVSLRLAIHTPNPSRTDGDRARAKTIRVRQEMADEFVQSMKTKIEGLRASGYQTYTALADIMNEIGFRTPRGKRWHPGTARNRCVRRGIA